MSKNTKSLDILETRVKQLLLESRCSFSEEEKVLLNDCLLALQQSKKDGKDSGSPDLGLIASAIELLTKLFIAGEQIKKLFH